jgi:hypothetical protein
MMTPFLTFARYAIVREGGGERDGRQESKARCQLCVHRPDSLEEREGKAANKAEAYVFRANKRPGIVELGGRVRPRLHAFLHMHFLKALENTASKQTT